MFDDYQYCVGVCVGDGGGLGCGFKDCDGFVGFVGVEW